MRAEVYRRKRLSPSIFCDSECACHFVEFRLKNGYKSSIGFEVINKFYFKEECRTTIPTTTPGTFHIIQLRLQHRSRVSSQKI